MQKFDLKDYEIGEKIRVDIEDNEIEIKLKNGSTIVGEYPGGVEQIFYDDSKYHAASGFIMCTRAYLRQSIIRLNKTVINTNEIVTIKAIGSSYRDTIYAVDWEGSWPFRTKTLVSGN